MRELPEPDHTESVQMSEGGKDWVRHVALFTRDQVLAIQKQAYEDGLRDAIRQFGNAEVNEMFDKIHAAKSFELESVRKSFSAAMLTASQEKK